MQSAFFSPVAGPKFALNQIVRGCRCGVFVVLDRKFCDILKQYQYILKEVNPANLSETAPGQLALHEDWLVQY